jgi:Helix-turn-helix domain
MTAVKTLSVPVAGREYFDLSRGASYAAAKRGLIPTIRIGGRIRVPIIALERMLERAGDRAEGSKLTA